MPDQNKDIKLQNLDIFALLRLEHLSEEEKLKRLSQMQQIVLTDFINTDLPSYLKDEEIERLEKMVEEKAAPDKIEGFLREKISDFDLILAKKFLEFKRQLVGQNMQTRLELNKKQIEQVREGELTEEKSSVLAQLQAQKEILEKILADIKQDNWSQVDRLVQELV